MKILKTPVLFSFLIFLSIGSLSGQYVNYGSDPWGQRWQQITTPHFKLIYPKAIDSLAQRYAWLLDTSYTLGSNTIGHKPIRLPVVLHPDNVNSNGVVVWAPRRMELMTTPPMQSYPQTWDKQLALHEFRHVAQIDKMNRGIMRVGYYLFGEQTSALWLLPVPKWFLEGDAIATETALSSSGRGRSSEFHMAYRTYLLSDVNWGYDRWVNGSYKYNVPDIYHFGYENVAYARYRYGADIWDKVLNRSSHRYFNIPAFSNALKKHTGLSTKKLQKQTFDFLKQQWIEEDKTITADSNISYHTPEVNVYTDYLSPTQLNDSTIAAIKTSMDKPSRIVLIDCNGKEQRLLNAGNINGSITSYRGKLYWSESVQDPRWEQRSYANLKSYEPASKTLKTHTRRSRYFSPSYHDSFDYYAAATTTRKGLYSVCVLDSKTDTEIKRFPTPDNSEVNEVYCMDTNGLLIVLLTNSKGMGIYSLSTINGEWNTILNESFVNISGICTYDDYIIFESGYSGVNNIYALQTSSKKIFKVTSARFGAFDPNIFDTKTSSVLHYSDYHKNGYRLAEKKLSPEEWKEVDWSKPYRFVLADTLSAQENINIDTIAVPDGKLYDSKPYRKPLHLFRPHSWVPLYIELDSDLNFDPEELINSIKPGFTLLSQNSLSTAITRISYSYENGYSAGHASFTYRGWYPVIDITANYGGGKQTMVTEGKLTKGNDNLYDIGANIYIPLTFSGTRSYSGLIPQVSIKHSNDSYYIASDNNYQSSTRLDLFVQHYTYSRSAVRDIYPRWGYRILLAHRSMPFDTENFGTMYGARLTVYTPGLFANHGLKLSGSIQRQEVERYYMSNLVSFPRGYSSFPSKELQFFSADYAFPVAYPDLNIGPLLYFKRLRFNLFTDIGENSYYGRSGIVATNLLTYGIDIIADYHVLRKEFPFMTGIRLAKPRNSNLTVEVLFDVSF